MTEGRLYYIKREDRFYLTDNHGKSIALHCGDPVDVYVHGRWIETVIEGAWGTDGMDAWYLVGMPNYRGAALQGLRARA